MPRHWMKRPRFLKQYETKLEVRIRHLKLGALNALLHTIVFIWTIWYILVKEKGYLCDTTIWFSYSCYLLPPAEDISAWTQTRSTHPCGALPKWQELDADEMAFPKNPSKNMLVTTHIERQPFVRHQTDDRFCTVPDHKGCMWKPWIPPLGTAAPTAEPSHYRRYAKLGCINKGAITIKKGVGSSLDCFKQCDAMQASKSSACKFCMVESTPECQAGGTCKWRALKAPCPIGYPNRKEYQGCCLYGSDETHDLYAIRPPPSKYSWTHIYSDTFCSNPDVFDDDGNAHQSYRLGHQGGSDKYLPYGHPVMSKATVVGNTELGCRQECEDDKKCLIYVYENRSNEGPHRGACTTYSKCGFFTPYADVGKNVSSTIWWKHTEGGSTAAPVQHQRPSEMLSVAPELYRLEIVHNADDTNEERTLTFPLRIGHGRLLGRDGQVLVDKLEANVDDTGTTGVDDGKAAGAEFKEEFGGLSGCARLHGDAVHALARTDTAAVRCCSGDGGGCASKHGGCLGSAATLDEAKDSCAAAGMRLCTKKEVLSSVCCGTGCGYDSKVIWFYEVGEYHDDKERKWGHTGMPAGDATAAPVTKFVLSIGQLLEAAAVDLDSQQDIYRLDPAGKLYERSCFRRHGVFLHVTVRYRWEDEVLNYDVSVQHIHRGSEAVRKQRIGMSYISDHSNYMVEWRRYGVSISVEQLGTKQDFCLSLAIFNTVAGLSITFLLSIILDWIMLHLLSARGEMNDLTRSISAKLPGLGRRPGPDGRMPDKFVDGAGLTGQPCKVVYNDRCFSALVPDRAADEWTRSVNLVNLSVLGGGYLPSGDFDDTLEAGAHTAVEVVNVFLDGID